MIIKRHIKRLVVNSLLIGSSLCANSATVSVDDARAIASEFMKARSGKMSAELVATPVATAGTAAKPLYYVFNTTDGAGFVIISAEDATAPVLGYSFEGAYPTASRPEAMSWVLNGIEREIEAAPSLQSRNTLDESKRQARVAAQKANEKEVVLATAAWSQEAPFNSMIPGRPLVGCVGTAMATIMKYHNWPEKGTGSFGGVDFDVAYDWESMRTDNYRSGYTTAEGDAVATLMYHASKSIDTQYAMSGSSAYEVRVPGALSTFFGYDPGVSYKKRADVATQADWDQIVVDEINAGRPVLYCGQDVTAGHAFVCDGYQGQYLHFNWGWGGAGNGFFLSTALNPTVSRTHHYNNLNTIIYNIKPATGTTAWSPIHITADGNQVGMGSDLADLSSGNAFTVRVGNLKNLSYDDFSGKIVVALYSDNGVMKAQLGTPANLSLQSMGYLYNGYMDLRNCKLPAGVSVADGDVVRLATQAAGATEWLPVAGELLTINELNVNGTGARTFAITLPAGVTGVNIAGDPTVYRGWDYTFNVTPENAVDNVVTVKANGYVLLPDNNYNYTINNVRENQNVTVLVQDAKDVVAKRSIWVETPGTLSTLISEADAGTIKDLTLFGSIDSRDFAFMRGSMKLERVDLSGVYLAAHGNDQANAMPRDAFRGARTIQEVILPNSVNRFNNACFFQCGIKSIVIPASVKTYEYNIFVGDTNLRDIYVGRETAEFINWCVLSGVKVDLVALHVPNEKAVANYSKAENWKTIGNIIVDPIENNTSEVLFAVMDDADVKFESETIPGKFEIGKEVSFTASLIPANDNRMEVYANSTLLTPDANGVYNTTLKTNTIVHFNMVKPTPVESYNSFWSLTAKNGSIGMFTDAVNVIPGQEFTIRVNALNIPVNNDQLYWAAALTDASGNIKEFISPVNLWIAGPADNHKFNVNCCVKESNVREGNAIRLVTSVNKRNWTVVKGATDEIVDAIPALNNQTEVYNIKVNVEGEGANITGIPETAVRGRDITIKVTPASAANRIDLTIDGKPVAQGAASIDHTCVVMADMDIALKVYDPKEEGTVTYNVAPGGLYKAVTASTVMANVVIVGDVYSKDLALALRQDFAARTIKKLDLSGANIIADVLTPTSDEDRWDNYIPSNLLYNPSGINPVKPIVEEIILPNSVTRIGQAAFQNCINLKEIRLPESLKPGSLSWTTGTGAKKTGYAIGAGAFTGCTSLTTIFIPGDLATLNGKPIVCHFNPINTVYGDQYGIQSSGLLADKDTDYSKITIVVPEKYLSVYTTTNNDVTNGNPWKYFKFNIVSQYPVYGVNFDASRVTTVNPDEDVTRMAEFLGENVALSSIKAEGKLKLINPDIECLVFDNGEQIQPNADGTIDVEFLNPAKNTVGVGNHNISVIYTYDLAFTATSDHFTVSTPEVTNDGEYKSGYMDRTNALAPVLKAVAENSVVKFDLALNTEHDGDLEVHVMDGQQELEADVDGSYTVNIVNAAKNIHIFAVPTNGATLSADDIAAVDPEQTAGITDLAFTGSMTDEELAQALTTFSALENLDLSDLEGELPESAFAGQENLVNVVLPEVAEIGANMFEGCSSLQNVDIPASVNTIGDGAFKGCESLESLSLTGVESIGDGAFDGCSNLTTITLLAGHSNEPAPAGVRAKSPAAGIHENAFKGLNPNCIIVLDEGVTAPASTANYIATKMGMITETMPDGTTTEREGRIYTADGNINFTNAYPLAIPNTFTVAEGSEVTLEIEPLDRWASLIVPFNVESVKTAGKEMRLFEVGATTADKQYIVFGLPEGGEDVKTVSTIDANTPYLWRTDATGPVTFSATAVTVPSTPDAMVSEGVEFALNATYKAVELPATKAYLLDKDGYSFKPAGDSEDEMATVEPFTVYATSPVDVYSIVVMLDNGLSGVEDAAIAISDLKIAREGNILVIYSPDDRTETLYDIAGNAVKVLSLSAGRNVVEAPVPGVYILAKVKIAL